MNFFRNQKIRIKFAIIFAIILALSILDFFIDGKFRETQQQIDYSQRLAAKNRMYTQRIALYSQLLVQKNKNAKKPLRQAIEAHKLAYENLKGESNFNLTEEKVQKTLALDAGLKDIFLKIDKVWLPYLQHAKTVFENPTYIIARNSENKKTKLTMAPNVKRAMEFIEENNSDLLKQDDELVRYYNTQGMENQRKNEQYRLGSFVAKTIALALLLLLIHRMVQQPFKLLLEGIRRIRKGHYKELINYPYSDDFQALSNEVNQLANSLNQVADFIDKLAQGNYATSYKKKDEEDRLGTALVEMRENFLTTSKEREKLKNEEINRNWVNQGLTKFGNILRQKINSLEELSATIVNNLVPYVNANQAGIFIINDDDPQNIYYELQASYAYNRRKFIEKTIEPDEGLVGACIGEQDTIHLREIPEEYISIKSGLGGASPQSLLLVPLKVEGKVLGVIELASFQNWKEHEIHFVEQLAENTALTLATVKNNERNKRLLEKFQLQSEEMAAQEEEMRQNLEELRATQEGSQQHEELLEKELEKAHKEIKRLREEVKMKA